MITALTVNYNTPELLFQLLRSFRAFYDMPYMIVDGSNMSNYQKIFGFAELFKVEIHHFDYNIHHGGGMAYGFKNIKTNKILLLDSDVRVVGRGLVEDLSAKLRPDSYGIGSVCTVDERGLYRPSGKIKYLHPYCALINRAVALRYPLPVNHGAPMINTMININLSNPDILQHEQWVADDSIHSMNKTKTKYLVHEWNGSRDK